MSITIYFNLCELLVIDTLPYIVNSDMLYKLKIPYIVNSDSHETQPAKLAIDIWSNLTDVEHPVITVEV